MTTLDRFRPNSGGPCPACGFVVAFEGVVKSTKCPQCDARIALTLVVGQHNRAIPCDDRCQFATGPWCSCSCGGDNHRRGYIYIEMVPAWKREEIRERDAKRHNDKKTRAAAKKESARQSKVDAVAAQREAHPELTTLLEDERYDWAGDFVDDMRRAIRFGRLLTPAQVDAVVRTVTRDREADARRAAAQAEREAHEAEIRAAGVRCPTGRVKFTGQIATVRAQDGYQGHLEHKMLVVTDEGWKVWGTVPRSLFPSSYSAIQLAAHLKAMRGRTVEITATVEPKGDDDPLFGYMKRPVATFVDEPAEVAA